MIGRGVHRRDRGGHASHSHNPGANITKQTGVPAATLVSFPGTLQILHNLPAAGQQNI